MKSLRELRNNTINFGNVFKAFKEAEDYIRELESLEEKEKNLRASISDLDAQHQKGLQRNEAIDAIHSNAQAKAAALIADAQAKADKIAGDAQSLVDAANNKVMAVLANMDAHNERVLKAKQLADSTEAEAKRIADNLSNLKQQKAALVKSLTE